MSKVMFGYVVPKEIEDIVVAVSARAAIAFADSVKANLPIECALVRASDVYTNAVIEALAHDLVKEMWKLQHGKD
jgi:hypothetical protein